MDVKTLDVPLTMNAWVQRAYGTADTATLTRVPTPRPGKNEVLVRVRATALNASDVRLMQGDPLLVRPFFGIRRPKQAIRGMDVAGVVVGLGAAVTEHRVGDEVLGELAGGGGLAPFAIARAERLVVRPSSVSASAAACLPIAAGTAFQAVEKADVRAGHRVLIVGASGGVGTAAVQLADNAGAEVWAAAGTRTHDLLASLGAKHVGDHRVAGLPQAPEGGFDAIIDVAGGTPLRELRRLLAPRGILVLVAGDGGHVLGPIPRMVRAAVLSVGSRRRIRFLAATPRAEVVRELVALVQAGTFTSVIERTWGFVDGREALAQVEAGHVVGKIVVEGSPE